MFIFKKRILESESGLFYLDKEGMLTDFKPSETNPIIKEKIEEPFAYNGYITKESISHLIIPKGVRGFADDFFRGITVTCRFELPEGLLFIGNSFHDNSSHGCVFSHCTFLVVRLSIICKFPQQSVLRMVDSLRILTSKPCVFLKDGGIIST